MTIEAPKLQALILRMAAAPAAVRQALAAQMQTEATRLVTIIQRDKLSGQVLGGRTIYKSPNRPGTLRDSIHAQVTDAGDRIDATIGTKLAYAAIHEYGGTTKAHVIEARNAKALAFAGAAAAADGAAADGAMIFRRRVNHPGSKIPERSYLRSTLAEQQESVRANLLFAVMGAVLAP